MKIREFVALLLCFAILFGLCGCGGNPTASSGLPDASIGAEPVTVTDMLGREVTVVPGSYKSVVCVGAGALRLYCYVGDVALLGGVEDIDNESLENRPKMFDTVARPYMLAYGDTFKDLPSCGVGGPQAQSAEAEKILSCNPDIVISEFEDMDKATALQEQLGEEIPVITLAGGKDGVFDPDFAASITLLGRVFAKEDRAAELVKFVKDQTALIEKAVKDIPEEERPSVYICGLGNWGTTNHLMTSETYASFRVAGVKNAVSDLGVKGVGEIEEEKFVSLGDEIDIMIVDAAAVKNIKPLYKNDPKMFDTVKAWQEGEVYLEMAYNAYYTNYEINLINTWYIAKTVYPEAFADLDMKAKTDEITKMFLGSPLADKMFACGSSFGGYGKIDTANFFK